MSDRRVAIEILSREGVSASLLVPAHVAQRPVQVGATSEIAIPREGVAPFHLALLVKDDRLLVSTVRGGAPAFTEAGVIPATWTELALPTHVLLGDTVIHLFWVVAFVGPDPKRESRRFVVRKRTPAKGLPIVTPPPRRALPLPPQPSSSSSITATGETQLHAIPRPPPAPSPPIPSPYMRRSPPRLGDALGGIVIDQTPRIPPSRPSSPTIVTELEHRPGLRQRPSAPNPIDVFFSQIVATWKRVEAWVR